MSRFDYVKYDARSIERQEKAKNVCEDLESLIESLSNSREKFLALTKLEECYMWIGKAIRDSQTSRGGNSEHRPERG